MTDEQEVDFEGPEVDPDEESGVPEPDDKAEEGTEAPEGGES
jgi:hypothetical protein